MTQRHLFPHKSGGGLSAPGFGLIRLAPLVAAGLLFEGRLPAQTNTNSDPITALRQLVELQNRQIQDLGEKVRQLEEREARREDASAEPHLPAIIIDTNGVPESPAAAAPIELAGGTTNPPSPEVSIGAVGFTARSADTNFVIALHGLVQVDSRSFFKDSPYSQANNGFLLRRARPILSGTVDRDFDFLITPDFGVPSVQLYDASVTYRFRPWLRFCAGKFKGPVDLEDLQYDTTVPFNEHSLAADLAPIRNLGFQMSGDIPMGPGIASWTAGIYNGVGDGVLPSNEVINNNLEFGGRLFLQPFKNDPASPLQGLGFGAGGSYSDVVSNAAVLPSTIGGTQPGYLTTGQQQFFAYNPLYGTVVANGAHWRFSPQGYYYIGPFGLEGEYVISDQSVLNNVTMRQAALNNSAWQISGEWMLTGEPASFNAITPAHSFDPHAGQWGAWQLVARYTQLNMDKNVFNGFSDGTTSAGDAYAWSAGINWWLNRNVRILTSFSQTTFQGGGGINLGVPSTQAPPATVAHQNEYVLFTRIQIAF